MESVNFYLCESEYRFAQIVWESAPINSGELVCLCLKRLGWKKSTTYTVLKKLCDKGFFKNDNATVTVLIMQTHVQRQMSELIVNEKFKGSLPSFIAAFMGDKKITQQEAAQLKKLIESYEEG